MPTGIYLAEKSIKNHIKFSAKVNEIMSFYKRMK